MDDTDNRLKQLEDKFSTLKDRVDFLDDKRVLQADITPNAVKMRHIGEGVRFIRSGISTKRPTDGETCLQGQPLFWATDTGVLSIWDGTQWLETTLT
jgi:hypothetical protein